MPIIHTKECHKPDLSDLPLAKRNRGNPEIKIGDPGPMGRILIDGEEGSDFIAENAPAEHELVIAKPGKDAFYRTDLDEYLMHPQHHAPGHHRGHHRGLRADDDALRQRPWLRLRARRGRHRQLLPRVQGLTLRALTAQGGIVGWTCTSDQIVATESLGVGRREAPTGACDVVKPPVDLSFRR